MSNWVKFPGNPLPVPGQWYSVSPTGRDVDAIRGQFTGYPAGFAQFVNEYYLLMFPGTIYWKEI
jgi:hypothetical protein